MNITTNTLKECHQKVEELASMVTKEARKRFGSATKVYWFGSWIKETAVETSDIDLAIDSPEQLSVQEFSRFTEWVEELPTLYSFDIINMNEISEQFKMRIQNEGKTL